MPRWPRGSTAWPGWPVPRRLDIDDAGFQRDFAALMSDRDEAVDSVDAATAGIIDAVRQRGDAALIEFTRRFDRHALPLRITAAELTDALAATLRKLIAALKLAAKRIETYHRRQLPAALSFRDKEGLRLGARWTALDAVGLYVPGGAAAYPSSVLMNAVPARVAGVKRVVMVTPAPDGKLNNLVLAAAKITGVREIYRVGGAQAVAALAYGTATIAPVDKITGPGNAYVAAAKRRVFGKVGIDMIAGPSEVVIVADRRNDPRWIALDLLAQAEHDAAAQSILITDSRDFADAVGRAVDKELETLPRAAIAGASWRDHGAIIVIRRLSQAPGLVDALAPEHLQLAVEKPEPLAKKVRHAGAIFLGRYAPEALGDYIAGPNHVLPTSRTARFSSGLGVLDFLKRSSLIAADARGLKALGPAAAALAQAEGLDAHAGSILARLSPKRPARS